MTARPWYSGRRRRDPERGFRYGLLVPAVLLFVFLGLLPFVQLLIALFQDVNLFRPDYTLSLENAVMNLERLFEDDRLFGALLHTVLFMAVALPIEIALGFLLAVLFLEHVPFKRLFIIIILIPTVIAPIVAGSIWRLMFDQRFGPINQVIGWITGQDVEILWTIDPLLVWPAIIVAEVWQWTPFVFLLLLAALSNLDPEPLEASSMDGAGWWPMLRWIVVPAILPVLFIIVLIRGLDLFRTFDVIWTMTQGGPGTLTETISIYTYQVAFRNFEDSYTAAIALLLIVVLTAVVLLVLRRVDLAR